MEYKPYGCSPVSSEPSSWSLIKSVPPYTAFTPYYLSQSTTAPDALGTVLLLRHVDESRNWPSLTAPIRKIRLELPSFSIVVVVKGGDPANTFTTERMLSLGVSAFLMGEEPTQKTLREALTKTNHLGTSVVGWILARNREVAPTVLTAISELISWASSETRVSPVLLRLHQSESTTRAKFRKWQLPPPHQWFQLGRALNCAMRIQRSPNEPLLRTAVELGYADNSGLSRSLMQTFQVRPSTIRGTLGWEWLICRWWSKSLSGFGGNHGSSDSDYAFDPRGD